MPQKKKTASSPHPAMLGFQQLMKTPVNPFAEGGKQGLKELAKQSGMTKTQMCEYVGNKVKKGEHMNLPSKEQQEQNARLSLLH